MFIRIFILIYVITFLLKVIIMAFEYDWEILNFPLYSVEDVTAYAEHTKTGPGSLILKPLLAAKIYDCKSIILDKNAVTDIDYLKNLGKKHVSKSNNDFCGNYCYCDSLKSYRASHTRIYCIMATDDTLYFTDKKVDW